MLPIIRLRPVIDDDLPLFFAQQQDPAAVRMVAFVNRDPADREAFMAHWAKIRGDDTNILRTILCDDRVAGYVGSFVRIDQREVCYWIGTDYWGRGVATAALALLLAEDKTRPLFAGVAADNVGSLRVLQKCGFTVCGRNKEFAKARGEKIEEVILTLEG